MAEKDKGILVAKISACVAAGCLAVEILGLVVNWKMLTLMEHPVSSSVKPPGGGTVTPAVSIVYLGACIALTLVALVVSLVAWKGSKKAAVLREQLDVCQRENQLNEAAYRQCEEERRALKSSTQQAGSNEVQDKDPRLYLSVTESGQISEHPLETRLVLKNRGESDAHNVEVPPIAMRAGSIKFDGPIGVIAPQGEASLTPTCDCFGPAFSRDLIRALVKEADTYKDLRETITIPVFATYSNFRGTKFEMNCDLIFNAINNALKTQFNIDKPSVEFHNYRFKKVTE